MFNLSRLVFGQAGAVRAMERVLVSGRPSHAYIFHGPPMVGKRTLALAFARALLCVGEDRPCGECRPCRDIARGAHPDLRLLPAAEDGGRAGHKPATSKGSIGIDQIRELRLDSVLSPAEGMWKVYIVTEADRLTPDAMNALLKTLEEPPHHVVLMLLVERPETLLPTITSRCQLVRLPSTERAELSRILQSHWTVDPARADLLAQVSGGRVGWAVNALSDPTVLAERAERLDLLRTVIRGGTINRLEVASRLAERYSKGKDDVQLVLGDWLSWWRDVLLVQQGCREAVVNTDQTDELEASARRVSPSALRAAVAAFAPASDALSANVNPRLVLEHLLLSLPAA